MTRSAVIRQKDTQHTFLNYNLTSVKTLSTKLSVTEPESLVSRAGCSCLGGEKLAGVPGEAPGQDENTPILTGGIGSAPLRALLPVVPAWLQLLPCLHQVAGHSDTLGGTV